MTLREAYDKGMERLAIAGVEEASLDAWYLLEYVTGLSRAAFLADSNQELEEVSYKKYEELIKERAKRIKSNVNNVFS